MMYLLYSVLPLVGVLIGYALARPRMNTRDPSIYIQPIAKTSPPELAELRAPGTQGL